MSIRNKELINKKKKQLIKFTSEFCNLYINEEYEQLCLNLINKMARKRNVPFLSGRINIWASSIIYALGQINFLFDPKSKPYINRDDIMNYFGTNKRYISEKAKLIRDMFKMRYWDREFSTNAMQESNPFATIIWDANRIPIFFFNHKNKKNND